MGQYFLQPVTDSNVVFELSATTNIELGQGSKITSYNVEDGSTASDNIVLDPRTASFSGVLTDVFQTNYIPVRVSSTTVQGDDNAQHVEDFIRELQVLIDDKTLFDFFATDRVDTLDNCIVSNFSISKDNNLGRNAWNISINLQQRRTATRAQVVDIIDADFADLLAKRKKGSQNSADTDDNQTGVINQGITTSDATVQKLDEAGFL